jgi:hypothetical protein
VRTVEEKARRRADLSPIRSPILPYSGPPSSWHTETKSFFTNKVKKVYRLWKDRKTKNFVV